jgi:anion-transporting  ArsA/GET3 family ATPase
VWTRLLLKTLAAHRTLAIIRDAGLRIAELGQHVREMLAAIKDRKRTQVSVVMLAEPLSDSETGRLIKTLEEMNVQVEALFINRVNLSASAGCQRCIRARSWQMRILSEVARRYQHLQAYVIEEFPTEIAGAKGMQTLTRQLWQVS